MNVGMINWGFVNGRTQTNLPWDSWERPYVLTQPTIWFHDILHPMARHTGSGKPTSCVR